MSDYISRKGIMKEFTDYVRASNNSDFEPTPNWNDAVSLVGSYPAADVVEVIRCKDCKYNSNSPECGNADCDNFYGMTDQMGFCHYGERRTDE